MRTVMSNVLIAKTQDGASSWAAFVESFRETAAAQMDLLPVVGFVLLVIVVVVLDWKIAKRFVRRASPKKPQEPARRDGRKRAA
ncbi:MAG: hypothetical protein RIB60_02785 [Phycisphaerales bacterium]